MKKRKDPLTGEEFIPKKVTQRFKTPSNQIKYNNQLQSKRRQFLNLLLTPMTRTHRILTKELGNKPFVKLHKQWCKGAGADMTLFTHIEQIEGKQFRAFFNYSITVEGEYYIIKKLPKYESGNM
jgi:hypothetical protein